MALARAPLEDSISTKFFPTAGEWTDGLFSIIVIHWDITLCSDSLKIWLLVDAVCQSLSNGTVVGDLVVF